MPINIKNNNLKYCVDGGVEVMDANQQQQQQPLGVVDGGIHVVNADPQQ